MDLFLIRTSISKYYERGSGMYAVPKLYKIGDAKRVVRQKNKSPAHPTQGVWEAVPVTLVEGVPTQFKEE